MRRILTGMLVSLVLTTTSGLCLAQDCPDLVHRSPEGISYGVAADGWTAYLANGAAVTTLDLSSPASPVVVGGVDLPYSIRHLAQDGDRVYVLTRVHLHIIDVGDPSSPFEIGRTTIEGYDLDADGDLLCVQTDSGLEIFDVSSPATPTVVGTWPSGGSEDFKVVGQRVFLANIGLQILDLSDPANPTQIGQLGIPQIGRLDVAGHTAYVIDDTKGLVVVDVSDPTTPTQLGNLDTVWGSDIAVSGDLAYLTDWREGLHVVDVSDPSLPQLAGTVPRPPEEDWGHVAAIADHGLVSSGQHGLRVIDATDASVPWVAAGVDTPGYIKNATHSEGVLYVAASERGLRTVDISYPWNPEDLAFLDLGGTAEAVDVEGDLAVVVGWLFKLVDISDPGAPVVVGEIPGMTGGKAVKIIDDLAFVANGETGLQIIDISIPVAPVEVGSLDPGGPSWWTWGDLAVLNGHVFMSGFGSIEVIDVNDPTNPVSVASIPGTAYSIATFRSWLLVGSDLELRIFDIRNPSNPVELDPYPTAGWIHHVGVSGSVAYLGIQFPGEYNTYVEIVDMGDPRSPVGLGQHIAAGFPPPGFAFDHQRAYFLRTYSGFDTFALCLGPVFADGFETGDTRAWSSAAP